jgi:integrase
MVIRRETRPFKVYVSRAMSRKMRTMAERATPTTDKGWQAKTFQARIRRQGESDARRIRIGSCPACSVADARRRLLDMKSIAKEGRDPALEQRRARAGVSGMRTLGGLIAEYLGRREGLVAAMTLKIERDLLEGVLLPVLGGRLLADLAPVDFGKAVSDYAGRLRREGRSNGTNANKLLAASRRMFKVARGWGLITDLDPTAGLSKPAKEAPRDRILVDGRVLVGPDPKVNELGRLAAALAAEPSPVPVSRLTRLALLLTLMMRFRALETCSLEWRAIDLDGEIVTTASKTKAGRRTLSLPKAGGEILRELRERAPKGSDFAFPAEQGAKRAKHLHGESLSRAFARGLRAAKNRRHVDPRPAPHLLKRPHGASTRYRRGADRRPRSAACSGVPLWPIVRIEAMRAGLEAWAGAIEAAIARAKKPESAERIAAAP